jgi:tRNA-dihydrouridine synthase B
VLEHLSLSLGFYGEGLGLRMFKKHLGYYIEAAPWPAAAEDRRAAKARLCRLDSPAEIERGLTALWMDAAMRVAA